MMEVSATLPGIPRVSVVMSTFNRAELLGKALDSILALDPPVHEVVVIDDGSSDRTAEVLAGFGPRVRFECRANAVAAEASQRPVRSSAAPGSTLVSTSPPTRAASAICCSPPPLAATRTSPWPSTGSTDGGGEGLCSGSTRTP